MMIIIDLTVIRRRSRQILAAMAICSLTLASILAQTLAASWALSSSEEPIRRGNPHKPCVALMFNVDWGNEYLPQLLNILTHKGVRATFFVVGRWARENPLLLQQIQRCGHEIASHGEQHQLPTKLTDEEVDRLIAEGIATLRKVLGAEPAPLFAPPSGDWDARTVAIARRHGCKTILWTIDTIDWRRPPASEIVARATRSAAPGSLILMHPTAPTIEALPEIIDALRQMGLEPTTVSETVDP